MENIVWFWRRWMIMPYRNDQLWDYGTIPYHNFQKRNMVSGEVESTRNARVGRVVKQETSLQRWIRPRGESRDRKQLWTIPCPPKMGLWYHTIIAKYGIMVSYHTIMTKYGTMVPRGRCGARCDVGMLNSQAVKRPPIGANGSDR